MYRLIIITVLVLGSLAGVMSQAQPAAANGNNAPVYNGLLVNQNFNRNYTFSYQFSCTCFSDPDGDHLTYTAALTDGSPLPAWLHFDGAGRTFSGTTENATGTFNIRVTATDTHAATATGDFTIQVQGGAPQFHGPVLNQLAKPGVYFSYTVPAETFTDPDNDHLTYTFQFIKEKPDWLNVDEPNRTYWGTPTGAASVKIRVTASDNMDGSTSGEWTLSTTNNLPPVYNGGIADQTWSAGHPYFYQFGAGCFSDPEGEPITYEAWMADGQPIEDLYPWIHFDGPTRTFSGTTGNNVNVVINCVIRASDATRSTSAPINITVVSDYGIQATAGAHGAISPPGTTYALAGSSLTYTITPDECYGIADVLVDGVSVGTVTSYAFNNITASHTISTSFTLVFVNSVSPAQGNQGQALSVIITGANLWGATSVSFGAGITVTGFTVDRDTQITASISILPVATPGLRNVTVTTPEGTGTLANGFTVIQTTQTVNTATGGVATFTTSAGSIAGLTAIAENTLPVTGKPAGGTFPYGLFSFNITGITPGSSVIITIMLPSTLPAGSQYWKCQNGTWVDMTPYLGSNDGDNVITLTLTDGGPGDADGVANGTIVDPGGPAIAVGGALTAPGPRASPTPPKPLNPAQMSLQYLSVTPQQTSAGQPVTITTNVVNTGDEAGNYNVALKINGQVEQTRMVSVGPQGTQPVKFTITKAEPGTYAVDIGGQKGSFIITGSEGTAGAPVNGGMIAILIVGVMVLATIVALIATHRRPA